MGEHLPNAPLNEALLEIKWRLTPLHKGEKGPMRDPAYPLFSGILFQAVRERFPFIERLPSAEVPDELTPHIVKQRFRATASGWPVLQLGPGILTVNFTKEYTWESFSETCVSIYKQLNKAYSDSTNGNKPEIESLMLRYINSHILSEKDSMMGFLERNLNTTLKLPETIRDNSVSGKDPSSFLIHVEYPLKQIDGRGVIRIGNGKDPDQNSNVIWELAIISASSLPEDESGFRIWLNHANEIADKWFLALVEGVLLDKFRRG